MYCTTTYDSPLGELTLAGQDDHLVGLWLAGQKYFGATLTGAEPSGGDLPVFAAAKAWLDRYFAGENPPCSDLSLAPVGSAFRQEVWKLLCEIPYGTVTTYGALAKTLAQRLGRPHMSAQAVGGAVGHNPISVIIPCHRVVGSDGSLTGYAGGVAAKQRLLALEGADVSKLFVPTRGTAL